MYHSTWRQRLVRWDVEQTVQILAGRLGATPSPERVRTAAALRRELAARLLAAVPPAALRVLDGLRAAGWRLGLVSNATSESAEAWPGHPARGAVRRGRLFVRSRRGQAGSGNLPGRHARAGCVAGDCVYIGDGADNELHGAAALGMRVVRTIEYGDTDPAWPGAPIACLADLPPLLSADRLDSQPS